MIVELIPAYSIYSPTPTLIRWSILRLQAVLQSEISARTFLQQGMPITIILYHIHLQLQPPKSLEDRGGSYRTHYQNVPIEIQPASQPRKIESFTPANASNW